MELHYESIEKQKPISAIPQQQSYSSSEQQLQHLLIKEIQKNNQLQVKVEFYK
jgi:hypothetical protein